MNTLSISFNTFATEAEELKEGFFSFLRHAIKYNYVYIVTSDKPESVVEFLKSKGNMEFDCEINNNNTRWEKRGVIGVGNIYVKCKALVDKNAIYHKKDWRSTSKVISRIMRSKNK